jgi:hypothetical protein
MISPVVQTETRHHLVIEVGEEDLASVEVMHTRHAVAEREQVRVRITLHNPEVTVVTEVVNA